MMSLYYFARAGRTGEADLYLRVPELMPLRGAKIALFGLGCVGAPSCLELARAGVGEMRLVDDDILDPGTIVRWPLGMSGVGRKKVDLLREFVVRNYPYTKIVTHDHHLGATRDGPPWPQSDHELMRKVAAGVSLIYDATAELGVQHFLSDHARKHGIAYVSVSGTFGGWGGQVVRIDPKRNGGCWFCYKLACDEGTISLPPSDPSGEIQPAGCANPTFTGAGFDLADIALAGVRIAISTLCAGHPSGYPPADWDLVTIAFRADNGDLVVPDHTAYSLAKHPKCPTCNP